MVEAFMRRALQLATNGVGFTSPNPCVGSVIVKGGVIVGEGWHKMCGADHAEIAAIKNVMSKSGIKTVDLDPNLFHNAVLYVTLEPCFHHGKTPPCVNAIVAAGFKKVCIGMKDPFKKVNGRSIKYLKARGVEVEICNPKSNLALDIRKLNQPFIKHSLTGLPYVVLKAGISLDGKIASRSGNSKWITGEKARNDAKMLRSSFDAVLVGASTVLNDDPELAVAAKFKSKKLLRIVVDGKLRVPLSSKIFRDSNVFVTCSDKASKEKVAKFKKAGVALKSFGRNEVSVKKLLQFLGKDGVQSVFVEGGGTVNGAFFDESIKDESCLDRVVFYIAPKILGGADAVSVIKGKGIEKVAFAKSFRETSFTKMGDDLKYDGILNLY